MFRRKADRLPDELAHENRLAESGPRRGRVAAAQAARKRRASATAAAILPWLPLASRSG
jgi:hypothetical protein